MRHTNALKAVVLGAVLTSITATSPTLAQRAPRIARSTPRTCVRFSQQSASDGRSITFELSNQCAAPVEATLSWSVACSESGDGRHVEHLELLTSGQHRVLVAGADSCGNGVWRIHDIRWSWRPQTTALP